MSSLLEELSLKAKELAQQAHARPAQELLFALEHDIGSNIKSARATEVASRIAGFKRGDTKLIPVSEVFETARRLTL